MPVPTVDPLPPSPLATDSDAAFDAKAFPFFAAWNTYRTQMIALGVFTEEQADAALAAAVAGGTLPSLAGKALQYLRVNAAADGVEFGDVLADVVRPNAGGVLLGPFATTSGTSVTATGIPSWATQVDVLLDGVSKSVVADDVLIRIGTSSGLESTGYSSGSTIVSGTNQEGDFRSNAFTTASLTGSSDLPRSGIVCLISGGANLWVSSHGLGGNNFSISGGGKKALSGSLDRVQLLLSGVGVFNGGSFTVRCR